jgi:hypothetical protein
MAAIAERSIFACFALAERNVTILFGGKFQ